MEASIRLAPPGFLARNFQLAGAGAMLGGLVESGRAKVRLGYNDVVVDKEAYARAAEDMLRMLTEGLYGARGPKLYGAGIGDRYILGPGKGRTKGAGLHVCGEAQTVASWLDAAKCYLEMVSKRGGPLGSPDGLEVPMLMKLTVFGRSRGPRAPSEVRLSMDIDSLGLALVGGVVSLVARYGDREVYIIPGEAEYSLKWSELVYASFHTVSAASGSTFGDLVRELMGLARERGFQASSDVMLQMAAYIHLSDLLEYISEVGDPYASFYLVTVGSGGNRPMGLSAQVVAASSIFYSLREEVGARLLWAVRASRRLPRTEEVAGVPRALAKCLHNLYNYYWSRSPDHLYECSRNVEIAVSTLTHRGRRREASALESLLYSLSRLVERRPRLGAGVSL